MIREFIRECMFFKAKDRVHLFIGLFVWLLIVFNILLWTGIINLLIL